jgi:hypothetical protein
MCKFQASINISSPEHIEIAKERLSRLRPHDPVTKKPTGSFKMTIAKQEVKVVVTDPTKHFKDDLDAAWRIKELTGGPHPFLQVAASLLTA